MTEWERQIQARDEERESRRGRRPLEVLRRFMTWAGKNDVLWSSNPLGYEKHIQAFLNQDKQ